jgi:hypothetical protein
VSKISRRRLIITGLAGAAGASGLGVAAKLAERYGLIPPDAGVLYGAGETLTCAAQRILTRHSLAREFSPSDISKAPFANEVIPRLSEGLHRMQRGGFADWRLTVDGVVGRPASFSLRELKSFPSRTQITLIACEDGWSYIAEWSGGVPPSLTSLTSWALSPRSIRCLPFDPTRLVGQHRHAGAQVVSPHEEALCAASYDTGVRSSCARSSGRGTRGHAEPNAKGCRRVFYPKL